MDNLKNITKIKTICIPASENHEGLFDVNLFVKWICPICGEPRGETNKGYSYDGGLRLCCDVWENSCGHIDYYDDIRQEALQNGLNGINRKVKYVVNLSGGKDSTAMLLELLRRGMPVDYILYAHTGKDFPQMIEHLTQLQQYIKKHYPNAPPITTIKSEKSFDYLMFEHIKTKGKNIGKRGYGWATMRNRWCTSTLKTAELDKFCKSLNCDVVNYVGIAVDEPARLDYKVKTYKRKQYNIYKCYPLVDWKMTEKDCLKYCYDYGFTWGGLYEHFDRVSCWCCPLKNLKELKQLYLNYPELWQELKTMDKKAFNKYRADYTVLGLEEKFKNETVQENLKISMFDNCLDGGGGNPNDNPQ